MSHVRKILSGVLVVGLVVTAGATLVYRQRIIDQVKVWSYQPSQEIVALTERGGFSGEGRFYFYVTHPRLEKAAAFNEECKRVEKGNPILGCYNQSTDTISIYDVDNEQLDGVREVTAAHEMLHAVFARLSETQRSQVAPLLEAAYQRLKTPALESRMDYYARSSPGARTNELHSILGTEFGDLGTELEAHYRTYFTDRQKVVSLHAAYENHFRSVEQELETLAEQLKQQKATIESDMATYEADLKAYNQEVSRFNARAASGDFTSQAAFNQERAALTSKSTTLEGRRSAMTVAIDRYNEAVKRYNALGGEMNELNRSLDSLKEVD